MTLLSLVPLVTVVFSIFSFFPIFASVRLQDEEFVFANFVPAASDVIHHHFSRFVANASKMASIGVGALVLVGLLLISAIDQNLNHIWRSRGQRPKMTTFAVYWMILTLGPLLARVRGVWAITALASGRAAQVHPPVALTAGL